MASTSGRHASLDGRRVLLIGGSAGIGRAVGIALGRSGARVAFAGRRQALCQEAAREAGRDAIALGCDVSVPAMCERVVQEAVDGLGSLDDVVYAVGLTYLAGLAATDGEWWQRILGTNVVGASLVAREALPHLQRSHGTAVFFSSVSSITGPWPGIGAYTASKAALNRMVETWRCEHPDVGFARIFIGATAGGATALVADPSSALPVQRWGSLQLASGAQMNPDSIASAVALVLTEPSRVWDITVQPDDPPLPWA